MTDPLEPIDITPSAESGNAEPTLTDADISAAPVALKRRKAPIFLASAVAVALVISVAAYAGHNLVFGGPQAAERLPASAVAYLTIDLTPGLDQTRKLAQLSKKLPQTGRQEDPKAGLGKALTEDLKGVDVKRDLTSWLGNRLGIAAWADANHEAFGLLALQSKDDQAAKAGLTRIKDAAKGSLGFTVRDGYALVAVGGKDAQAAAEAAAAEATASPLSGSTTYTQARDWLDDDQVAIFYADFDGIGKIAKSAAAKELDTAEMADFDSGMPSGSIVVGLRAEDDGVSARYRSFGGKDKPATPPTDALAKLGALPAGTAMGVIARLPEDAKSSPLSFGLPFLLFSGGDAIDIGDVESPLTPAEEAEFEALMDKQLTGKLTKAEQKRFDQLNQKMMGPYGAPPKLTKAQQAELDALMSKSDLTEADNKRIAELLGMPDIGSGALGLTGTMGGEGLDKMFDELSGGLLSLTVTNMTATTPSFRAIVELAKSPDATSADRWADMLGKNTSVKLDGTTLSLQSDGFAGNGRLADDPLFRRASAGSSTSDAQMAVYVDLTRAASAQQKDEFGPVQAIFISGGADSGTARVLIG